MPTGFIPAGASARPMSPVGRALSPGPMSAVPLQQFATPMLGGAAGAAWRGAGEGRGAGVRGERRLAHVRQLACVPACAAGPSRRRWRWRAGSCCRAVTSVCCAGVGITFEPDLQYGSPTNGMHIITKIRPNSPADKSKLPPEPAGLMISASRTRARAPPRLRAHAHARTGSPSLLLRAHGLDGAGRSWSARRVYKLRRLGYRGWE